MTLDGMRRQSVDLIMPEGALGFNDLGIDTKLTAIEDVAERWLVRFRKMSVFVEDGEIITPALTVGLRESPRPCVPWRSFRAQYSGSRHFSSLTAPWSGLCRR